MPPVKFKKLNGDLGRCSAWLPKGKRCCQNVISIRDQVERDQLLSSITGQVRIEGQNEDLVDLFLCKRYHRSGKNALQSEGRQELLSAVLAHYTEEITIPNAKQTEPQQPIPAKKVSHSPVNPQGNATGASHQEDTSIMVCMQQDLQKDPLSIISNIPAQQQVSTPPISRQDEGRDSIISVNNSPPSSPSIRPNQPQSSREGSALGLDEQSVPHRERGTAEVADLVRTKISNPIQEMHPPSKATGPSATAPSVSLEESEPPAVPQPPKPRQSPSSEEKAIFESTTSLIAAPQELKIAQPPKPRRSPRFIEVPEARRSARIAGKSAVKSHPKYLRGY